MHTSKDESEVSKMIHEFIHDGTPAQLEKLTWIIRRKNPSVNKKSIYKMIAKHRGYSSGK
ncbi:MAG: hypothetical protein ACN4GW_17915 [Desulforhopalus sp.]